jgi:Uncharacterized protein conserved in bacteria (DUF2199)
MGRLGACLSPSSRGAGLCRPLIMRHDVFVSEMKSSGPAWTCSTCGDKHEGLATTFGPFAPDVWLDDTRSERSKGKCDGHVCLMTERDGADHGYIRGHLELRVADADLDCFVWSVWVELAKDEFNLNLRPLG